MMSDAARHGDSDGPGHALERMIFFSDAVFAIAITLLVIELHIPELARHASDLEFVQALANMTPNFVGFFVSFFVIGAFWSGHHRAFVLARHWDPKLILPNLMLLCTIAAMPFFTAFSSAYYSERVPVMLYCGWLLLTALCNMRLQRIVTAPPVVREEVTKVERAILRERGYSVALGSVTALVVAIFVPILGQPALMSIMIWRRVLRLVGPKA
jgi:uncharacterized membrane protein